VDDADDEREAEEVGNMVVLIADDEEEDDKERTRAYSGQMARDTLLWVLKSESRRRRGSNTNAQCREGMSKKERMLANRGSDKSRGL
jgi:hypothetical protein